MGFVDEGAGRMRDDDHLKISATLVVLQRRCAELLDGLEGDGELNELKELVAASQIAALRWRLAEQIASGMIDLSAITSEQDDNDQD